MKRRMLFFILFAFVFIMITPYNTRAISKVKSCVYKDDTTSLTMNIYNDYTAVLNDETSAVNIKNWADMKVALAKDELIICPRYIISIDKDNAYVSNSKDKALEFANKNNSKLISLSSSNYYDKTIGDKELFRCKYSLKINDNKVQLTYRVLSKKTVMMSFSDGEDLLGNGLTWYHGGNFAKQFLKAIVVNDNSYVCPTLTAEMDGNNVSIFSKTKIDDSCNGVCTKLKPKSVIASSTNISTGTVVDSCVAKPFGLYDSLGYYFLYFRVLDSGVRQWSIDGANYTSVSNKILFDDDDNKESQISLNKTLISNVFESEKINCSVDIYRCVSKGDNYNYELSADVNKCKNNSLGSSDGQLKGSTSYGGSLGADGKTKLQNGTKTLDELEEEARQAEKEEKNERINCVGGDRSLLGDPDNKESVAWLIQNVLNYIKIAGPILVIIFSSIDFLRALIQSDDDTMSKLQKKLITRIVLAVFLFFVPTLVNAVLSLFGMTDSQTCRLE